MARVEAELEEMGSELPEPVKAPPGMGLPFSWVRARGSRAYVSGHAALDPDGTPAGPFGKVGAEVSPEGTTRRRVWRRWCTPRQPQARAGRPGSGAWLTVTGMVNAVPGFAGTTNVINGFSDLILELYGSEAGVHARTAPGVAALPLNTPVIILAEVETDG